MAQAILRLVAYSHLVESSAAEVHLGSNQFSKVSNLSVGVSKCS